MASFMVLADLGRALKYAPQARTLYVPFPWVAYAGQMEGTPAECLSFLQYRPVFKTKISTLARTSWEAIAEGTEQAAPHRRQSPG